MRRVHFSIIVVVTLFLSCVRLSAQEVTIESGFTQSGNEIVMPMSPHAGVLATREALKPGYYALRADYRTEGFEPLGRFTTEMKSADGKASLSQSQMTAAISEWAPLSAFFHVESPTAVHFRFSGWQGARSGAVLHLRNVRIEPFEMKSGTNWLTNGDWEGGAIGELPPNWILKDREPAIEAYSLVANTSYRSGKHVLRMTGTGKEARVLASHNMPLPPGGEVEFSVWARSNNAGSLNMHIVRDGWGNRAERQHTIAEGWKKYKLTWPVVPDPARKWFFVRMDKDPGTSWVEIADVQVTWRPASATAQEQSDDDWRADALRRGWQGTPGKNLLYNPDMELGGTGFYYDFSWPKQYSNYFFVRNAKPTQFLSGKGVDGGTCVWVQGSGLRAYCFPVTTGKTYTVSADLRAPEGKNLATCSVLVTDSEWNNALVTKVADVPGGEWKRYHWTFEWKKPNIQRRGYVRFDSDSVLVDRIQVVEGKVAEYEAPPVMLGLITTRNPYFVRGRDEARATIRVVPGKPQEGTAAVEVIAADAWGQEAWRKAFDVSLDKVTEVPVELPTDKLGNFHVSLTARIAGEVAGIGINRYAIMEPSVIEKVIPGRPGLAGICQETFNFPVWLCEDHARIHTDLGIRFNRFFASIPADLPSPMPAGFAEDLLAKCKPFNEAGIDLMPCIELIPAQAAKASQNLDMPTPETLKLFGEHVEAYVTALQSGVRYWEIFNEPNLWRMTSGPDQGKRTMYPAKYVEFQKVAYTTIKRIDPSLQVVCNALNNVQWDWIDEWFRAGGDKYMDAMSFHPYSVTNFFDQGTQLRQVMAEAKFTGPLINSEKYFGANIFYDRSGYEETRRGYYLPHDGELATAGRSIQHFVSSAAHRVPVAFFNPWGTLSRRGPGDELFVYDFFPAYNAAIRFMANAGYGQKIDMGPSIDAILFKDADGGPLLVLWSPNLKVSGLMRLDGDFVAYDIMGNPLTPEQRKLGVRIATDPTYLRFKPDATVASITALMTRAEVVGLGAPIEADLAITGPKQVSAYVTSATTRTISGKVSLLNLPQGWSFAQPTLAFNDLRAGSTQRLDFTLDSAAIQNLQPCAVSFLAESGDEFLRKDVSMRPLFVQRHDGIKADGDLREWRDDQWLTLGDDHVSVDFDPKLKRTGDADLSAKVATAWSEKYFAVAVVVTDDVHSPGESALEGWRGDSLQVYLAPRRGLVSRSVRDDIQYTLTRIGDKDYAWLDKGAEGNFKGVANRTDGLNDADVNVSIRRQGNQTIYEAVFPRDTCLPGVRLDKNEGFGFSLLINDNDGHGRKTGLTLAPKGSQPYQHPEHYLSLILQP